MAGTGFFARLPRPLQRLAWPLAALLLTGIFFVVGFPYDALARRIESELAQQTSLRVQIGELSPGVGLAGPYLGARDVVGSQTDGARIVIDELRLRPGWSLSWLMLDPALHVFLQSAIGNVDGQVTLRRAGFQGRLENVDLGFLPVGAVAQLDLDGRVDADVDLRSGADEAAGLEGALDFQARDGSLAMEGMPIAVPYTKLEGRLLFGGEALAVVERLELESPLASASASGTVKHGPAGNQPLDLSLEYEVKDVALVAALRGFGLRVAPRGRNQLQVAGTLGSPMFR